MKTSSKKSKSKKAKSELVASTTAPASNGEWRFVKAKYDGICTITGYKVKPGDWIAYNITTKKVVKSIRLEKERTAQYLSNTENFIFNSLCRYVANVLDTTSGNPRVQEIVMYNMPNIFNEIKSNKFYLHEINPLTISEQFMAEV